MLFRSMGAVASTHNIGNRVTVAHAALYYRNPARLVSLLVLMLHHGRGWVFRPRGLTATSSTLTKPSETVVAGSKVPSAVPANTCDVCVALGLVCACSCEQETLSSRIPAKT